MTNFSKNEKEVSLVIQKIMYQNKIGHKASLLMLIRFYEHLLNKGVILVDGAAHSRLKTLKLKYYDKSSKK